MNQQQFYAPQPDDRQWADYQQQEQAMANVNDMVQSKYLKQADVPDPVIVTIQGVKQVNMAKEGEEPEYKWAIKFQEFKKPMILNSTNIHVAAKICGSTETDEWRGKEIVLYTDPNVSFAGQVVGGLRFRGQEKPPQRAPVRPVNAGSAATPGRFDEMTDDVPF